MPHRTLDARPRQAGRFCLWRGLCGRISGHSQTDVVSLNAAVDLPYEDYCGLIGRPIGIEDTMRVKAAKRPGHPKKRDAERVRNRPVNYELGRQTRLSKRGLKEAKQS